jgi:hypothetical protein
MVPFSGATAASVRALKAKLERARTRPAWNVARTVMMRLPLLRGALRMIYRVCYRDDVWMHVMNRRARRHLVANRPRLDDVQARAVEDLRRDGIAVLPVDRLLGPGAFEALRGDAMPFFDGSETRSQIDSGRSQARKYWVVRVSPPFDLTSRLVRFAVDERVLAIVNSYLGVAARLKNFELWWNMVVPAAEPVISSQMWHRDYDDKRLVKAFLYLNDVGETSGPFSFLRGTHPGGRHGHVYPNVPPEGSYPGERQVEACVPADEARVCTGPAGALVLCDTVGFHRGGRPSAKDRILYTVTWASDAAVEPDLYPRGPKDGADRLGPMARYAIRAG